MSKPAPVLFFFSSINPSEQGYIEAFGNWLLRPVQVLTGIGRDYHDSPQETFELRSRESNWMDTTISIVALPFSLIFGPTVKFLAYATDKRMRDDEKRALNYNQFRDPPRTPLEEGHKATWFIMEDILKLTVGINEGEAKNVWQGVGMQAHINVFKSLLEKESELLFNAFQREDKTLWKAIIKLENKAPDHTVTYPVKYLFLIQAYFYIRKGTYYDSSRTVHHLEDFQRERFFIERTPEYHLREAFNAFLTKFEKIFQHIGNTDKRYYAKERKDENPDENPKEYSYSSFPYYWQLIGNYEINAVLADQKRTDYILS